MNGLMKLKALEDLVFVCERIHDDLVVDRDVSWTEVKEWLEAAYDVGYSHGRTPTLESESSASDWAKKMWGGQFPPSGT